MSSREDLLREPEETEAEEQERLKQEQERLEEIEHRIVLKDLFEHDGWKLLQENLAHAVKNYYDNILAGQIPEKYHQFRGHILEANRILNLPIANDAALEQLQENADEEGGVE